MTADELMSSLEGLPTDDPEGDHSMIDQIIADYLAYRVEQDDPLASHILEVWEQIEVKWYS
jgi:hypothetical protein